MLKLKVIIKRMLSILKTFAQARFCNTVFIICCKGLFKQKQITIITTDTRLLILLLSTTVFTKCDIYGYIFQAVTKRYKNKKLKVKKILKINLKISMFAVKMWWGK